MTGHVLIVDDVLDAAALLREFLELRGWRVSVAGDGVEGYERFCADPCDLLITDIKMPRSDGKELIRRVRKRNGTIAVIVVTGFKSTDIEREALAAGADLVLGKPVDLREIAAHVESLIAGRRR